MTKDETCYICKKPIGSGRSLSFSFYDSKSRSTPTHKVHIARKCTDKILFTASERVEMDRVIAMTLMEDQS